MSFDRLEKLRTWLFRLLLITVLVLLAVIALGVYQGRLTTVRVGRLLGQVLELPGLSKTEIALVAGHRGFDTGAMCDDGFMEVMVTEEVSELVAGLLREEGVLVDVLDEYDSALNGLQADALVSIHVDSCVSLSGFKATSAEETILPELDSLLVTCLERAYAGATGLSRHPSTETSDMYGYHAFQRIDDQTPAAIIEIGFIGGDRELLTQQPEKAALGIAAGILCYLEERPALDLNANPRPPALLDSDSQAFTSPTEP
ncbi:MAG: hypothetical protein GY759_07730 [Chloroflexi bacterium]|nr:hypothetical protein [Chloroflexota bacterium]